MIYKTYLDKVCTICENNDYNSGINPVAEIMHGKNTTRMLIHFDHTKIKQMIDDKIFADRTKIKHILKLTNAASLDFTEIHCGRYTNEHVEMRRATSFDLIFFLIPTDWDGGKGFNLFEDDALYRVKDKKWSFDKRQLLSKDGCNWYQPMNGYKWEEPGVYSNETLSIEYDNFATESGSTIIIGRQHFDIGNENIEFDLTDIVNRYIDGELENYGLGVAFTPMTELEHKPMDKNIYYISFFSHKTNTFFEPYLETIYNDPIDDNRGDFTLNKHNRLYLFCNIGGRATNLDELPICTIDGVEYPVIQHTKGVYYADVLGDKNVFNADTMYYDTWSNLKYQGVEMDDVEMDFVVHKASNYFNFGNTLEESVHFTPTISGIRNGEEIKRGDLRKLSVIARQNYTKNKANIIDEMQYRIYIKDGTRNYDVLEGFVDKTVKENFFIIDTSIMLPQRYYVDIKIKYNMEEMWHNEILTFDIVDMINNKYN